MKPGLIMEKRQIPDTTADLLKGKTLPGAEIPQGKIAAELRLPKPVMPADEPLMVWESVKNHKLLFNIAKTERYPLETGFIKHTVRKNETLSQ